MSKNRTIDCVEIYRRKMRSTSASASASDVRQLTKTEKTSVGHFSTQMVRVKRDVKIQTNIGNDPFRRRRRRRRHECRRHVAFNNDNDHFDFECLARPTLFGHVGSKDFIVVGVDTTITITPTSTSTTFLANWTSTTQSVGATNNKNKNNGCHCFDRNIKRKLSFIEKLDWLVASNIEISGQMKTNIFK